MTINHLINQISREDAKTQRNHAILTALRETNFIIFFVLLLYSCNPEPAKQEASNYKDTLKIENNNYKTIVNNGEEIKHYNNGVIKIKGTYLQGKRVGQWISFYSNGNLWSEVYYSDGIKDGPTATWFENGKKRYEGFYRNDKESGKWTFWNQQGEKVKEKDFQKMIK